MMCWF